MPHDDWLYPTEGDGTEGYCKHCGMAVITKRLRGRRPSLTDSGEPDDSVPACPECGELLPGEISDTPLDEEDEDD